jgi:hypothetical protein
MTDTARLFFGAISKDSKRESGISPTATNIPVRRRSTGLSVGQNLLVLFYVGRWDEAFSVFLGSSVSTTPVTRQLSLLLFVYLLSLGLSSGHSFNVFLYSHRGVLDNVN